MTAIRQDCICDRFSTATEAAALAASDWVGKADGLAGLVAASEAMSDSLASISFSGRVVAGRATEGLVGSGTEVMDLAVAPLEGYNSLGRGLDGALSMLAAGPAGSLMPVPEMYMQKIVVGADAAGAIDLDLSIGQNIYAVAEALGRQPEELTVAVLDRPRHEGLIEEVTRSGARLKLMDDGDVSAGISAAVRQSDVDMYIGIGGSTEGIITAAAMRCLGGEMLARFWPVSRHQVEVIKQMGLDNAEATLTSKDMAKDGVLLAATAVTRGRFLRGVEKASDGIRTETMVMCSRCHKIELVRTIHRGPDSPCPVRLWAP